jgi:hypothetical protein
MGVKVALFFLLDSSKASAPQNYGMQLPVQKVAPLYDSISASSRFAKMSFPDSTVYGFSFFKKPYQTDMLVVLKDLNNSNRKTFEAQCHAQLVKLLNIQEPFYFADYVHQSLWMPRGLQKQEFLNQLCLATGESEPDLDGVTRKYIGANWVMNYRKGYIFGGKSEADYCRSLALYGLGLAYHRQMALITNRLAHSADLSGEQLNAVKLEASSFMAHYLFDNPVLPAHIDTYNSYQHIAQGLNLDAVEQQFRKKLADLSQLAATKSSKGQADGSWGDAFRAEKRKPSEAKQPTQKNPANGGRNLVLAVVATALITVGLLSLSPEPLSLLQQWLK